MLYPNVQNMTSDKVNRYMLVIATAKCARKITDMMSEEREAAEERREGDRISKEPRAEATADNVNEKAVSTAIDMINSGECRILTD